MPPRRFRATKATRRRRAVHRLVWLRLLTKTRNKHLRPEICRDAVRAEILNHYFGEVFDSHHRNILEVPKRLPLIYSYLPFFFVISQLKVKLFEQHFSQCTVVHSSLSVPALSTFAVGVHSVCNLSKWVSPRLLVVVFNFRCCCCLGRHRKNT